MERIAHPRPTTVPILPYHPLDEYRIEKERLAITLTMAGGEALHGHIFVQPGGYGAATREGPRELFNGPDPFFPIELDDGQVMLISKTHVLEVSELPAADEDVLGAEAPMTLVQVTLVGGVDHFGSMRLEVRADRPRLVDYLNACHERFLTLHTDHGVRLINRALIARVRPLD